MSPSYCPDTQEKLILSPLLCFHWECGGIRSRHCILHSLKSVHLNQGANSKIACFQSLQHDTTVSGLQMALDVYNGVLPPYASCHMMELYHDKG